jgi:CxxC motif-containing protein (DUF1111 family)
MFISLVRALAGGMIFGLLCGAASICAGQTRGDDAANSEGRELFLREWIPSDPRSGAGDGLGPLFNDTSCVACHSQGGVGGAGPAAKNIQILSVFRNPPRRSGLLVTPVLGVIPIPIVVKPSTSANQQDEAEQERQHRIHQERSEVSQIHPEFAKARSIVLHRFSTESSSPKSYRAFRANLTTFASIHARINIAKSNRTELSDTELPDLTDPEWVDIKNTAGEAHLHPPLQTGPQEKFVTFLTERNPSPLFGSGKIDAIPDEVLASAAEKRFEDWPEVSGRVAKLKDGRIGRFGWKANKARLHEFVLTACAIELGLHVPGERQAVLPVEERQEPPGLDLDQKQCDALTAFVAGLPSPQERKPASKDEADYLAKGRELFSSMGCAACHTPQLGEVEGIDSDLLLHDMGEDLSDSGEYQRIIPNATEEEELNQPIPELVNESSKSKPTKPIDESKLIGATRAEWRTPPLWGLRDSAPYLHDGRADTIEQAIAFHGGEATRSMRAFFKSSAKDRLQVTLFLRSLVAPELVAPE